MRKRIIAGLLCLLLLSVLLPGMAMAVTRNTTLDCTGFTGDESGDGWSWEHSSKTLTIENLQIEVTATDSANYYGIKLPAGATLNLVGNNNSIFFDFQDAIAGGETPSGRGIDCPGDLTINGVSEARWLGFRKNGGDHCGIYIGGNLTLNNAIIDAQSSSGVMFYNSNPTPTITCSGYNEIIASYRSIGVTDKDVTINGNGVLMLYQQMPNYGAAISAGSGSVTVEGNVELRILAENTAIEAGNINIGNLSTIVKAAEPFSSTPAISNDAVVFAGSGNGNLRLTQSGTVSVDYFLDMLPASSNGYEVPSGMTLTVASGATLQISGVTTIHNYGTIANEGTLGNYGSILLYGNGSVGGDGTIEGTGQIKKVEQTSGGAPAMWYTVTATAGPGGTITPSGKRFLAVGQRQEFRFNPEAGYSVESVIVNGSPVTIKDNSYTLEVRGDSTIQVAFAQIMEPPQTGDASSQYGLGALIMAAGLMLLGIGQFVRRRQNEK